MSHFQENFRNSSVSISFFLRYLGLAQFHGKRSYCGLHYQGLLDSNQQMISTIGKTSPSAAFVSHPAWTLLLFFEKVAGHWHHRTTTPGSPPPPIPLSQQLSSAVCAEQWASAEWCRGRRARAGKRHYGMGGSVLAARRSGGPHSDRRMPSWKTRVHPHEEPWALTLKAESAASEGFGHCAGFPWECDPHPAGGRGLVEGQMSRMVSNCKVFHNNF